MTVIMIMLTLQHVGRPLQDVEITKRSVVLEHSAIG